jgi:hypothetical protein
MSNAIDIKEVLLQMLNELESIDERLKIIEDQISVEPIELIDFSSSGYSEFEDGLLEYIEDKDDVDDNRS